MKILSIDRDNFNKFLENLSGEFDVYAPVKFFDPQAGDKTYFHFKRFNPDLVDKIVVGGIRASEPIKSFLAYSRERVDAVPEKKQVLVGIKACDIQSLPIQDFVFMNNDPKDPFYTAKREGTYIISSDCDLLYESCFCTAAGNVPYPGGGFDLNLSASARGYLVEVGSDKGRELIKKNENFFTNAEEREVGHRNNQRREFTDSLRSQVDEKEVPGFSFLKGKMKEKYPDSKLWEETATLHVRHATAFLCQTRKKTILRQDSNHGMPVYTEDLPLWPAGPTRENTLRKGCATDLIRNLTFSLRF